MNPDKPKSYTLRVPFQVQPGHSFGNTGGSSRTEFGTLTASLDQTQEGYALCIAGFPSTGSASSYLHRVWTGLTTLLIEKASAFSGSMSLQQVISKGDTAPSGSLSGPMLSFMGGSADAIADGDAPSVCETGKKVAFVEGSAPQMTITTPAEQALSSIPTGLQGLGSNIQHGAAFLSMPCRNTVYRLYRTPSSPLQLAEAV
jgi:hypothetical protein